MLHASVTENGVVNTDTGCLRLMVGGDPRRIPLDEVIVAGFTGRDRDEVDRHVAELASIGVPAPDRVPAFYPVEPESVQQTGAMRVTHQETSGEAEIAIVGDGGEWLVTLASDHTDRRAEMEDLAMSKRLCPKPVAREAWRLAEVDEHWDALELRSWIEEDSHRCAYQSGSAASLLPPPALLEHLQERLPDRFLLLCGTVPVHGAIRPAERFIAELRDPVAGRAIRLDYAIELTTTPSQEGT